MVQAPNVPIDDDRDVISISRVLCIFFMLFVHVPPGSHTESLANSGDLGWLSTVLVDVLGRCSVPLLSLISGYLLFRLSTPEPIDLVRKKAARLLLPLLWWNIAYLCLQRAGHIVEGEATLGETLSALTTSDFWLQDVSGITGQTANISLFFIRDVFVSLIMISIIAKFIKLENAAIILTAYVFVGGELDPIVFRENILLFATIGAALGNRGASLRALAFHPRVLMTAAGLYALTTIADLIHLDRLMDTDATRAVAYRTIVAVGMLWFALLLTRMPWRGTLAACADLAFTAYLSHMITFGVAWFMARAIGLTPMDTLYPLFFLSMPLVAFVVAARLDALVRWRRSMQRRAAPVQHVVKSQRMRKDRTV
jgi:surface polysaccharide O-acyltransferase-like enzyme